MKYVLDEEETQTLGRSKNLGTSTETEITLGLRSLLSIFFGLVLVCGIFFGLGYSVGRSSGSRADTAAAPMTPQADSHLVKPSATQSLTPAAEPAPVSASTEDEQPEPAAATAERASAPVVTRSAAAEPESHPEPPAPRAQARTVPAVAALPTAPALKTAAASPAVTAEASKQFVVQIAAVRLQQDADVLVAALKKHGYSPAVRGDSQDSLLRVQVGPFASRADANAMRGRLLADGYNAVVK